MACSLRISGLLVTALQEASELVVGQSCRPWSVHGIFFSVVKALLCSVGLQTPHARCMTDDI